MTEINSNLRTEIVGYILLVSLVGAIWLMLYLYTDELKTTQACVQQKQSLLNQYNQMNLQKTQIQTDYGFCLIEKEIAATKNTACRDCTPLLNQTELESKNKQDWLRKELYSCQDSYYSERSFLKSEITNLSAELNHTKEDLKFCQREGHTTNTITEVVTQIVKEPIYIETNHKTYKKPCGGKSI